MLSFHKYFFQLHKVNKRVSEKSYYTAIIWFAILIYTNTFLMVVKFTFNVFDPTVKLESLAEQSEILFLGLAICLKTLSFYNHKETVEHFFTFVETHQTKLDPEFVRGWKKKIFFFILLSLSTGASYNSKSFFFDKSFSYNDRLIFQIWLPFEMTRQQYLILMPSQYFFGFFGALVYGVWCTFIFTLMIFVSKQYEYIQDTLINLKGNKNNQLEIQELIVHHRNVKRFSDMLNDFMNPLMTTYLFTTSISVCSVGFQLMVTGLSLKSIFLVEYTSSLLFQLFIFYWFANEIFLSYLNLHYATWKSKWYEFSKADRQLLIMVRNFWLKTEEFYVGPVHTMSLNTYLSILQGSYSYMMILYRLNSK